MPSLEKIGRFEKKNSSTLVQAFGLVLVFGLTRPFFATISDNLGLPIIGEISGLFVVITLFVLAGFAFDNKNYPHEIFILLLLLLCSAQIFNPQTTIARGISTFISYYLNTFSVYLISSRLIKDDRDIRIILSFFYVFSIFNLIYGIYVGINGVPSFAAREDDYTEMGELRIRALTGSEQAYYISVFITIAFSYFYKKQDFYVLLFLMALQMLIFVAKNPLSFLLLSLFYSLFICKKYRVYFLIIYIVTLVVILVAFINITTLDGVTHLDSWLSKTPFGAESVVDRYWRWLINVDAILANPLGYGLGTATKLGGFEEAILDKTQGTVMLGSGVMIAEPHSQYMEMAVEASIFAPIILLIIFHLALSRVRFLIKQKEHFLIKLIGGFIFGYTFISIYNSHIFGGEEKYMFWFLIGLVYNKYGILQKLGRKKP
jgi:hypothetical protein